MDPENKQCQNCRQEFRIEPEDFVFYEKVGVPLPKMCPDCRYQRRLAHRNERTFFKRNCNATGGDIIALYPQDTPFPVYEQKHWEGGNWDALQYGRDFDFSKPFFEQFVGLQRIVPRINLRNFESVNSEYTNQCERNKNCYLLVASSHNENVMYGNWAQYCKDMLDINYVLEGELCYETIAAAKSHRLFWCKDTENCFDCWLSFDLKGCHNCFLCSNLRNKSYFWENKPLTKQEWLDRFSKIKTGSYSIITSLRKQWLEIMAKQALHKFADHNKTADVTGDALFQCKNVHKSFNMTRAEDCKYCQDGLEMKDCWDNTEVAFKFERDYELHGSANVSRSICSNICWESHDLYYCDLCSYSTNLFGCIALKHKNYCILNKQYSKEEYQALLPKIIDHMKKTGEWGEFFPIASSVFSYNESTAFQYFPLSKDEVLQRGWMWNDNIPGTYDKGTIKTEDIPGDVKDVSDAILNEILTCISCNKNYRILKQELSFYRGFVVPIPRQCPNCRHYARFALRNPRKLWHRKCMCAGASSFQLPATGYQYANTTPHFHNVSADASGRGPDHEQQDCPNEFETSYAPERPEIVYCEQCYNAEVA